MAFDTSKIASIVSAMQLGNIVPAAQIIFYEADSLGVPAGQALDGIRSLLSMAGVSVSALDALAKTIQSMTFGRDMVVLLGTGKIPEAAELAKTWSATLGISVDDVMVDVRALGYGQFVPQLLALIGGMTSSSSPSSSASSSSILPILLIAGAAYFYMTKSKD